MKSALIIGSEGQDGKLLKMFLGSKGYKVFGLGRGARADDPDYTQFDLAAGDPAILEKLIVDRTPSEIYYVAAFHQSSQENNKGNNFEFIEKSIRVNQTCFMHVLEICRIHHPTARIFYTSSSLIFSGAPQTTQNEDTTPEPRCVYSVTKCAAMEAAKYYSKFHNLFVTVGIMYNHESIFRNDYFLSKKIIIETRQVLEKKREIITVGDLEAVTDWGYAPDYVEGMWHTLQLGKPGTFVFSSGKGRKVKDWFEVLFNHIGKNWQDFVKEDKSLMVRKKPALVGDNSRLLSTGWKPKVSFEEMVLKMYNNSI